MRAIWGEMAPAMLRKRLRDVGADADALTREAVEKIVELLRVRTLPSILGEEGAESKAKAWRVWVRMIGPAERAEVATHAAVPTELS